MLDSVALLELVYDQAGTVVDFRICYVTSRARDVYDHGPDDMLGSTIGELYADLGGGIITQYVRVLTAGDPLFLPALASVQETPGGRVTRLNDVAVSRVGDMLLVVWRDVTDREQQRQASAQLAAGRAVTEQLQRGLLPPPAPQVPGLASRRPTTPP